MKLFLENPFLFEYFGLVAVLLLIFGASFFWRKIELVRKPAAIALALAPIIYFFLILDAHLLNIPYIDDFNLLETIYNFREADGFLPKTKILFEQVNQHRFAFERIVMLIMVFFTGTVSLRTQIFIGDLFLLGILYFLFKALKKEHVPVYTFLPVPYLLFNLVFFENAVWGIAAIQNTPLIFFAFLSAYGLSRRDKRGFWLGIVAALVTTFTSGSGLLTWIIGILILGFQKRFRQLVPWVIIAAVVIVFYFKFSYVSVKSDVTGVFEHPVFNTIFALSFWGNAFFLDIDHPLSQSFYPDIIACVLLGAAILGIFLLWFVKLILGRKLIWSDWFLWGAMMFVLGTGAMFVVSRPISNYIMYGGTYFSRRYMIFGVALLAVAYVCLISLLKKYKSGQNLAAVVGMLGFVLLNFVSYFSSISQVRKLHDELLTDTYFWKNYKTLLTAGKNFGDILFWNHPTHLRDLIINLKESGLTDFYQYHHFPDSQNLIAATADRDAPSNGGFSYAVRIKPTEEEEPARYYSFRLNGNAQIAKPAYFVLDSPKHKLILPAIPARNSLPDFFKTFSYYSNNLEYSNFKSKLPDGTFKVWIMENDASRSSGWRTISTGKTVKVE